MKYLSSLPVGLLLFFSISITVLGDFFAKYWSNYPARMSFWCVAMLCWMLANVFFIPSLLTKSLVVSGMIFTVGNILGFTTVGFLIFGESLGRSEIIGIFLGFAALVFLVNIVKF